jgi:hypothetical protein
LRENEVAKKREKRQCQPCTACCDGWVQMVINGTDVYPGHPCPHSTGKGCDDYENRPEDPCHHFMCGWIIDKSPLPDWMQPENAKVIVLFDKFKWRDRPVDLAVPVGKRIPPRSLEWLQQFSKRNARPLVYTQQTVENGEFQKEQQLFGYGPAEFQKELLEQQEAGVRFW